MNFLANYRFRLLAEAAGVVAFGLMLTWNWPGKVPILREGIASHARRANRERWYQESHKPPPTLLEIRTTAEAGDPQAENSLAQVYASEQDFADAVSWYRKAAAQGHTNAQFALAQILLQGRRETATSGQVPQDADEGVMWLAQAANRGDVQAQIELGGCYQRGAGVDANLVEAYKWFKVAARQSNAVARVALEQLQVQISHQDIEAGEREARLFEPSRDATLPEPSYLHQLRLTGIMASGKKPLAMVNNRTLEESEEVTMKLSSKTVTVRCLKIEPASVLVQVGPFQKQLRLAD